MSVLAGKIASITGMVQATNPITGEVRVLKVGDEVLLGDIITTPVDGSVTISLDNGDLLTLGRNTKMAMSEDVVGSPGMTDPVTEGSVDVAALQQAVLEGNFDDLEETAAGGGDAAGGSANAGATNTVERLDSEGEVTSGFDTSTATTSSIFVQEDVGLTEVNLILTAVPVQITENETLITYTATLDIPAITDMEVTLDNGAVIFIPAGEITGSTEFNVVADPDVYIEADTLVIAEVSSTEGGGFNAVNITNDASTTIVDTIDDTVLTLEDVSVNEGAGTASINASLTSAPTDAPLVIALDNGATITFAIGSLTATSTAFAIQGDDVYVDGEQITVSASVQSGGTEFENLVTTDTATVTIADTQNDTVLTLEDVSVNEGAGTASINASLTSAPTDAPLVIALDNGSTITFAIGSLTATSTAFAIQGDDVYTDAEQITVSASVQSGGSEFENLVTTDTATVTIADTIDDTTVTLYQVVDGELLAKGEVLEAGTATYALKLDNPTLEAMVVQVSVSHVDTDSLDLDAGNIFVTVPANSDYVEFTIDNKFSDAIEEDEVYSLSLPGSYTGGESFENVTFEGEVETTIIENVACDVHLEGRVGKSDRFGFDYPETSSIELDLVKDGVTCITNFDYTDDVIYLDQVIDGYTSGDGNLDQYLTFDKVTINESYKTIITVDSDGDGDLSTGTTSILAIDGQLSDGQAWKIVIDNELTYFNGAIDDDTI